MEGVGRAFSDSPPRWKIRTSYFDVLCTDYGRLAFQRCHNQARMMPNASSPANAKAAILIWSAGTGAGCRNCGGLIPGTAPSVNAIPAVIAHRTHAAGVRPITLGPGSVRRKLSASNGSNRYIRQARVGHPNRARRRGRNVTEVCVGLKIGLPFAIASPALTLQQSDAAYGEEY